MEQAPHALASLTSQSPAEVSDFFSGVLTAAADTPPSSAAAQCALSVFRDAARRGLTAELLEAELRGAGVSEATSAAASRSWSMHGTDARWALTAGAIGARKLIDAEWTFGVTASSSEHAAVGTTYVQVRMVVEGASGPEYEHMEMSLPRFYEFVHDLERAKAQLELI